MRSPALHVPRRGSPIGALLLCLGLFSSIPAAGQVTVLTGRVVQDTGAPVSHAEVSVSGSSLGALTDEHGTFGLRDLPAGEHELLISAIGYATVRRRVTTPPDGGPLTIVLRTDAIGLAALTVTGTMKRISVGESPVKVEVVPSVVLRRGGTNNLPEALQYVNGLYNQVDCGVCYTNSIRINGMEGPYTAVLIDGMPLMGSLASVYGLHGIHPALIEQIEIIKGPSSTLYGSEAMAGVVNVITKDPRFAPRASFDASLTSDAEGNIDLAVSLPPGDVSGFLSGNASYNRRTVDDNGDGFTDFPLVRRGVVFGKLGLADEGERRGDLSVRYVYEDRFGGVTGWTKADRGSDSVYGESIYTNHFELIGSWLPGWSDAVRVEGSWTWHDQDSFYGTTRYDASQHVAFGNLLWGREVGGHDLLAGATVRYQRYDDDTPATALPDGRLIPGLLVQDEYHWGSGLTALGGLRVDHHEEHGTILSPRLALKWEPLGHTAVRLNVGTGFRVVDLFTEDHAALTGSREVVLASELRPERSRSLTLNVNQIVEFGPNPMMIDLDVFHTRFSNKIVPDYDQDPNLIVYDNLRGHAVSRGVAVSFNQNVDFDRFLYSVGVTFQDVHSEEAGVREAEFFAATVRGVASATYAFGSLPLRVDYTGSLTGPMRLPLYAEPFTRPDRSPTYSLHNIQATWSTAEGTELYLSAKNLFDYVQPSALVDPAHPFRDSFDTAYVYGPLRGRHLMLGFRHVMAR